MSVSAYNSGEIFIEFVVDEGGLAVEKKATSFNARGIRVLGDVPPIYDLPPNRKDPFEISYGYGKKAGPGLLGYDVNAHTMQPPYLAKYAQERGLIRATNTFNLLLTAPAVVVDCYRVAQGMPCSEQHEIPSQSVADYCRAYLGMYNPREELGPPKRAATKTKAKAEPKPEVVIKEVEVIVETPLALTFDERTALEGALHRQQHIANEYLRRAMVNGDAFEVEEASLRLKDVLSLMTKLDIEPEPWTDNLMALTEAGLIIPDAQPTLFG